jgi:Tfp pilus assembly protein PilN
MVNERSQPGSKGMSFLPEDYIEHRVEQRTNLICLSLFVVVMLALVGAYMVTSRQRHEVIERQKQINAEYAEAAKRIAQLNELQQRKQQLLRKAQITATLIEPVPRSNLLAELINRMPQALSLLELDLESKKLTVSPITLAQNKATAMANAKNGKAEATPVIDVPPVPKYDVTVSLEGIAPTDIQVAQYMAQLARCELLKEVNLVYAEEKRVDESSMRRFKVVMTLDSAADIREIKPLLAKRSMSDIASAFGTPVNAIEPDVQASVDENKE